MATSTPIFPQVLKTWSKKIVNADGTGLITILTAGSTDGSKIESILCSSTDSSSKEVNLFLNDGTTSYRICRINIPANSGNSSTIPPVDILKHVNMLSLPIDSHGNRYIILQAGWLIQASMQSAVTSGAELTFIAQGGNY